MKTRIQNELLQSNLGMFADKQTSALQRLQKIAQNTQQSNPQPKKK